MSMKRKDKSIVKITYQKCYLSQTFRALDIKTVDLNAQISLSYHVLFASVELFATINVFSACGAPHVEGRHETNDKLAILLAFDARYFRCIEIGRIVFLRTRKVT